MKKTEIVARQHHDTVKRVIWKYPLEVKRRQQLFMPPGAVVLSAGLQNNQVVLWAMHSPDNANENIRRSVDVYMLYTGEPFALEDDAMAQFVGTVQLNNLVYHVFWNAD